MKNIIRIGIIIVCALGYMQYSNAHSGGTIQSGLNKGCHVEHATGKLHCHNKAIINNEGSSSGIDIRQYKLILTINPVSQHGRWTPEERAVQTKWRIYRQKIDWNNVSKRTKRLYNKKFTINN